ncbi:PAS domain S-box protein [Paraglaciecola sp. L3A3]|uniref:PAS domain S-box protein n=1 Tax=Paraglaciecola sp. L3A3 TaxID=2686358 RepID=UPI00131DBBD2|nr:PAS domain S-box protein [Paraglaciecola sp. L3A3]
MALRIFLDWLISIQWIVLCLFSRAIFAVNSDFTEFSQETINVSYLTLGIISAIVLILLLVLKFKLSNSRKTLNNKHIQLNQQLALQSEVKSGIVHINTAGHIVYINSTAATLLGGKADKLLQQTFASLFSENCQEHVKQALSVSQYSSFQTYLATSRRHLHLGFSQADPALTGVAYVLSLVDVTNYQNRINQVENDISNLDEALINSGVAKLSLDFVNNTFTADPVFVALFADLDLELNEIKSLNQRITKAHLYEWEQALAKAVTSHQLDIRCELIFDLSQQPVVNGSQPIEQSAVKVVPIRCVGLSREKNAEGQTVKMDLLVHDLTELTQQKNANQAQQIQIKTLLTSSPNPIYITDKDANLIDCNLAFERLFKLKQSNILGKSIEELALWPEEINKLHMAKTRNTVAVSLSKDKEFVSQLADGKPLTLKLKLQEMINSNKQSTGMLGVLQDLTELTQTKAELLQTRKHFTTILDLAPLSVATIDADDRIVSANIAMTDKLGVSERDLKQGTFYQLFNDPSNAGKAAKLIQQTGRLRQFHAHIKGKNGELYASELHVDLLNKEKQEYLCWISDRAGEQFQQDKFESLLQHSSMPMAILSEQGFTQLNPAACEFFKIEDQQELLGEMPYSPKLNVDEIAATELERQVTKVKLDGKAKFFSWQHKVGNENLPCQVTYVPMYKGQEFDSILCLWMDFRQIQQADQARKEAIHLHQEAEKQVAEKQQQLQSSQAQLVSKMQNLAKTESQLQAAQDDLSEKQQAFSSLQEAHDSVTHNLQSLQKEYKQNRSMLAEAQDANSELTAQLEESIEKVTGLQNQRNQISDALQYSEKKFKAAQKNLQESEKNAENLQQQQMVQQNKMQDFVAEIEQLQHSIEEKDQQINQVGSQISSLQSQLTSSDNTSEKLRQSLINQRKASEQAELQRRQLEQTCKMAQSELTNKVRHVEHLQNEMQKFEEMSTQQKGDMQQQQTQLMQELQAKQEQLQETEHALLKTIQQTEAEKREKKTQQALLEKLQTELSEMEQSSTQQKQKIAQTDQDWQQQQQALQSEVQAKRHELANTQGKLAEIQSQADTEKLARLAHQQKLEQLTVELSDVENRASKQKEMIEGSDEQWRKHHAEIELQKQQLQQALLDAEKQNTQLQETLAGNLQQLQVAESQVSETQSGEQKLQQELDEARKQAEQLAERLKQQELQENKLQQQLKQQQNSLQGSEQNIHSLEAKQAELTQALASVQKEYADSKESLNDKHSDHAELSAQLKNLEQELQTSKQQLDSKESALQEAKQQLETKESMLAAQESELLEAHKEELQQAQEQEIDSPNERLQAIAQLTMPSEPAVWFDLLHYLQKQTSNEPLPVALKALMEEFEQAIELTEQAIDEEDVTSILRGARKLSFVAQSVNSAALTDVVSRLETDCQQGLVDNISISWPTVKRSLNNSLRVIYSHLKN